MQLPESWLREFCNPHIIIESFPRSVNLSSGLSYCVENVP